MLNCVEAFDASHVGSPFTLMWFIKKEDDSEERAKVNR
jgi:hypothetical protein